MFLSVGSQTPEGRIVSQNNRASRRSLPEQAFALQPLESRRLLSAAAHAAAPIPLIVTTVSTSLGEELSVTGDAGSNTIIVEQSGDTLIVKDSTGWYAKYHGDYAALRVTGGSGNNIIKLESSVTIPATLRGGAGNDTIYAGSGTDELIGGPKSNILVAGSGTDTLVSIGSNADTLEGGSGFDSFWADAKSTEVIRHDTVAEIAAGAVHEVSSFLPTYYTSGGVLHTVATPSTLKGQKLPEPSITSDATTWANFSNDPLFSSSGPSENDIEQGTIGDCYFLSTLSSIAKIAPNVIQQSVVDLGDGTYAVRFQNDGASTYVRVDSRLPLYWAGSEPAYARLGQENSLWVAIMEKAFADYRDPQTSSYAAINAGDMSEALNDLGLSSSDDWSFASSTDLALYIQQNLNDGMSVTYATLNDTAQLIGGHAYTVDSVITDTNGNVTGIVLRNPWGPQAGNNGYVTVTPDQLFADLSDVAVGCIG
jgi:hypothetical protein